MATIRVPPNCGGMTLTTSGALIASGNLITGMTAAELTSLVSPYAFPGGTCIANTLANGLTQLWMPLVISNITINGVGYAVTNGLTPATIPAADASAFIAGGRQRDPMFELVVA